MVSEKYRTGESFSVEKRNYLILFAEMNRLKKKTY